MNTTTSPRGVSCTEASLNVTVGSVAKEAKDTVTVRLFDGTNKTIPRTNILAQTNPVSVMPAMGAILQPTEIRDVVTYLSSLKGGRRGGRSDGEL